MNTTGRSVTEECPVRINLPEVVLEGSLCLPQGLRGIVIFAHSTGKSDQRNRFVAQTLQSQGIGTLLFDLISEPEEINDKSGGRLSSDIGFLADRLVKVTDWLPGFLDADTLESGYLGFGAGAAAALVVAAGHPQNIRAIVSQSGRLDLVEDILPGVKTPTLLVVGGADHQVVRMNQDALRSLNTEKTLVIVPGATHLFEEPGTLEKAARLATGWFLRHFSRQATGS